MLLLKWLFIKAISSLNKYVNAIMKHLSTLRFKNLSAHPHLVTFLQGRLRCPYRHAQLKAAIL